MQKEWIYGFHAIEAALKEGHLERILIDEKRQDKRSQNIVALLNNDKVHCRLVDVSEIDRLFDDAHIRHQGIAGQINIQSAKDENALYNLLDRIEHSPFLLILDEVQDPHNVGACLRTAEAFGVDAVIVPKDNSCGLTPIVRKVSSGSSERIPFIEVTNLVRMFEELKSRGIWISGLAGSGERTIFDADFNGSIAIVMGSEGKGLRRLTEKNCDFIVKIPMEGEIESLNVSVATGITLAEAFRQRHRS